jgi:vacuolar-type H+-ATPase subunit E/Vma4
LKECVNGIRKELLAEAELKRDEINAQNMKRRELLRKKKENWDQVTEELKQKVSAKTQLSRYRKRQSQ